MNQFEHTFRRISKEISLTDAERSTIQERLLHYQKLKPIRLAAEKSFKYQKGGTIPQSFSLFFSRIYIHKIPALASLAIVILAGGVSYAAEGTLPGNLFYPIKTTLNEEIRTALLFSKQSKIEWDIARSLRRLDEAATLLFQGAIPNDVEQQLQRDFKIYTQQASARIALLNKMRPADALIAAAVLEDSLRAHAEILTQIQKNYDTSDSNKNVFAGLVTEAAEDIAAQKAKILTNDNAIKPTMSTNFSPSLDTWILFTSHMKKKAIAAHQQATRVFAHNRNTMPDAARHKIEALLQKIALEIQQGTKTEDKTLAATKIAFSHYQNAFTGAHKLTILLQSASLLQISPSFIDGYDDRSKQVSAIYSM